MDSQHLGLPVAVALWTGLGQPAGRLAVYLASIAVVGLLVERLLARQLHGESCADALERLLIAAGLGLTLTLASAGLVHLLPGPMTRPALAGTLGAGMLALGIAALRSPDPGCSIGRSTLLGLALLTLLAGALRLPDLGSSEFRGDEASVMLRAAAMVQGVEEAPLAHRKGPGELLLSASAGQVAGRVTESDPRVPFALMSLLAALAFFALGRAIFGERAGLLAALLWSINGYAVAFGRIVQYHSLVLFLTTLAALCAWRFRPGQVGPGGWFGLAADNHSTTLTCSSASAPSTPPGPTLS